MIKTKITCPASYVLVAVLLSACGGGGSSSSNNAEADVTGQCYLQGGSEAGDGTVLNAYSNSCDFSISVYYKRNGKPVAQRNVQGKTIFATAPQGEIALAPFKMCREPSVANKNGCS